MRFIAIDFETARAKWNTPCEIGLAKVEEGRVTEAKSFYIRPQRNEFYGINTSIHGITAADVADAPEFPAVFAEIKSDLLDFPVIAHNATFDIGVLTRTLELYEIDIPEIKYGCSLNMSRLIYPNRLSYKLGNLCDDLGIELERAHRGEDDARACAELVIRMWKDNGVSSLDDFDEKFPRSFTRRSTKAGGRLGNVPTERGEIFAGKHVCITGSFQIASRAQMTEWVTERGGIVQNNVTQKTDYLLEGQQSAYKLNESGLSTKQRKALSLLEKGHHIELIDEVQLYELIGN